MSRASADFADPLRRIPRKAAPRDGRDFSPFLLLWLSGAGLRLTILAIPPLIPQIRADLHLSQTEVGLLSGLPPVLFALTAIPGSLLIARFGATATLVAGLLVAALGGALRGLSPNVEVLFFTTVVMSMGVAVMQPAMPPLVRKWTPQRVGFATAIYTNGLLMGEVLPVALSVPLILPLVGGYWRPSLVLWSVPLAATALLVIWRSLRSGGTGAVGSGARRWRPDWRDARMWRLGFMFGAVNSIYFATNGFLPGYFVALGRPDMISAALTALNLGQIPASVLLLVASRHLVGSRWPYAANGLIAFIGLLGVLLVNGVVAIAFAALIGFACAGTLILALALPPLLSEPEDVHRMSAGMFTISYTSALIVPVLSGALWDLTGSAGWAFAPSLLCACVLVLLTPGLDLTSKAA
ncbi:MAG TPA: MFS transporter [Beijerinckiaceae bacterium]|nr:MFS transporter [Beijerinckiaceae bacterium]